MRRVIALVRYLVLVELDNVQRTCIDAEAAALAKCIVNDHFRHV
jgi:hypothetical protein